VIPPPHPRGSGGEKAQMLYYNKYKKLAEITIVGNLTKETFIIPGIHKNYIPTKNIIHPSTSQTPCMNFRIYVWELSVSTAMKVYWPMAVRL
jgi:hypothetical protein